MNKILVFIPTYEEVENVQRICRQIMALPLPLDLHFMDDGSPDGTGEELDQLAGLYDRVSVTHRPGKLGIGTAHQQGIALAYEKGYEILITMDCDFTHDPTKIPDLLAACEGFQVVLGSRYLQKLSLPGWSLFRKSVTMFGHFLTRHLLLIEYDSTNAFRLYDLRTISPQLFLQVRSRSYSFFFESLFILVNNGILVKEIPVALPNRAHGHSKLSFAEAFRSAVFLFKLTLERLFSLARFRVLKVNASQADAAAQVRERS